jgi:hypothetical protein
MKKRNSLKLMMMMDGEMTVKMMMEMEMVGIVM